MISRLSGRVFMEIRVELPDGKRDLYSLISSLERYDVEIWDEIYRRRPDSRGRMAYREAEITLWVDSEDYKALCITLGKLAGNVEYTTVKPRNR
ncbi:MAG: hypothetical protein ABIJ47_06890 [Candidatus Bathyarchaeota archaeon]